MSTSFTCSPVCLSKLSSNTVGKHRLIRMPRRKSTVDKRIYPLRLTRSSVTRDTKANESVFKSPGISSFKIDDTKDDHYDALHLACQDVLCSFIVKGYHISFEVVLMEHVSILCFAVHDRTQNSSAPSIHVPHAISLTLLTLEIARVLKPCLAHFEQFCNGVVNTSFYARVHFGELLFLCMVSNSHDVIIDVQFMEMMIG